MYVSECKEEDSSYALTREAEPLPGFSGEQLRQAASPASLSFSVSMLKMRYYIWWNPGLCINTPWNQDTLWKM